MSSECIRARMCSGYGSHQSPVGMDTQGPKKRASYIVVRKGNEIANYHKNLIKVMKTILAIMGFEKIDQLSKKNFSYKNNSGEIFFDIDKYFKKKLQL